MHARITTVRVESDKEEEALGIIKDSIVLAAGVQPGFQGFLVLHNPDTAKALCISLWDTREDLEAGENSGYYREQLAQLTDVLVGQPVRESYEVRYEV